MDKEIERRISAVEKRLSVLEDGHGLNGETLPGGKKDPEIIEIDLVLPEADIGGLHFSEQKVRGVFKPGEGGKYYSRDILFHSARDTDEGTGRDLLSEYLESRDVKDAFIEALTDALVGFDDIRVFLPEENLGIMKYNGGRCWYWLRHRYSANRFIFSENSFVHDGFAGNVGGCSIVLMVL
jgi:hypothetical protein